MRQQHFPTARAVALLDGEALAHNYHYLLKTARKNSENARVIAVVKANAYGHGLSLAVPLLSGVGCDFFAVATLQEGLTVRALAKNAEILVLGYTPPERVSELHDAALTQTVFSRDYARALARAARRVGRCPNVHLKIDCGMHRLGFSPTDGALAAICESRNLRVSGLFTHFPASDTDGEGTRRSLGEFLDCRARLEKRGFPLFAHAANSAAALTLPEATLDAVRVGLSLYGIAPTGTKTVLRPVLSLHAPIVQIRTLKKGERVGYGGNFVTKRRSRIGVLPIGYADGFSRRMSALPLSLNTEKGRQTVPVSGLICMDQTMVDLTGSDACVGDSVTLFSRADAALHLGITPYELLSALSPRVERILK